MLITSRALQEGLRPRGPAAYYGTHKTANQPTLLHRDGIMLSDIGII